MKILQGDCLGILPTLGSNWIDSVVTDPPYGLKFMGKDWDHSVPGEHFWREILRVAKPGAHLLAFGGTRTYHRLVCAIEDAGWEIRDTIAWVYGQGFSKSFNMKRVDICSCVSGENVKQYSQPQKEGADNGMHLRDLREEVQSTAILGSENEGSILLPKMQRDQEIRESGQVLSQHEGEEKKGQEVRGGESVLAGRQIHRTTQGIYDGQGSESSEIQGQRICLGTHSGGGEDVGKAVEAGGRSSPHQSQPGRQQAGKSADIREPFGALDGGALPGRGCCPKCGLLRKEFEGFGTGLKPAFEPIVLARKPFPGTVAANAQEYGTGALNIDGCRISTTDTYAYPNGAGGNSFTVGGGVDGTRTDTPSMHASGRWPANFVHDGSEEVVGMFPDSSITGNRRIKNRVQQNKENTPFTRSVNASEFTDSGSAARFFYTAKASRAERNHGLSGMRRAAMNWSSGEQSPGTFQSPNTDRTSENFHPTVKPISLMTWLCRLITPPGGIILDPFMGSGSTGVAAKREGFDFIGIELDPHWCEVAKRRIGMAAHQKILF